MAIFTGQQGHIPRYNMEALTAPGRNIGAGIEGLAKSIEKHRLDEEKKTKKQEQIDGRKTIYADLSKRGMIPEMDEKTLGKLASNDEHDTFLGAYVEQAETDRVQAEFANNQALINAAKGGSVVTAPAGKVPEDMAMFNELSQNMASDPELDGLRTVSEVPEVSAPTVGKATAPSTASLKEMSTEAVLQGFADKNIKMTPSLLKQVKANTKTQASLDREDLVRKQTAEIDRKQKVAQVEEASVAKVNDSVAEFYRANPEGGTVAQLSSYLNSKFKGKDLKYVNDAIKTAKELDMVSVKMSPMEQAKYDDLIAKRATDGKELSEKDKLRVVHHVRQEQAEATLDALDKEGYDPTGKQAYWDRNAPEFLNMTRSEAGQTYYYAADAWLQSLLRNESGAAIPDDELRKYTKTYFPVPGDKPMVVEHKTRIRKAIQWAMSHGLESFSWGKPTGEDNNTIEMLNLKAPVFKDKSGTIISMSEVIKDSESQKDLGGHNEETGVYTTESGSTFK